MRINVDIGGVEPASMISNDEAGGDRWQPQFIPALLLVIANIATIGFFVIGNQSIAQALWVYWLQSVIIGMVNVARIIALPIRMNIPAKVQASGTAANPAFQQKVIKIFLAGFFMFHYGFFHLVYMIFLFSFNAAPTTMMVNGMEKTVDFGGGVHFAGLALSGALFGVHHILSYIGEKRFIARNPQLAPSSKDVFGRPYARILPLHLIIIIGPAATIWFGSTMVFVLFMILRTVTDLYSFRIGIGHSRTIRSTGV